MAVYNSAANAQGYSLRLTLTETVDAANNKSKIAYTLQMLSQSYYFSTVRVGFSIALAGTTVASRSYQNSEQYDLQRNSSVTIASGTFTVTHNADGTKSYSAGQVVFKSLTAAGAYAPSLSGSNSTAWTLTPIARSSTFTASNATMGEKATIKIVKSDAAYKHSITYVFGSKSGTAVAATSASEVSWTPPFSLASEVNVAGGAKYRQITYTLHTFSGNTEIGTTTQTVLLYTPTVTLSAPAIQIGGSGLVTIQSPGTLYHTITYTFGAASGTVADASPAKSIRWNPPATLGRQIRTSTSGKATLNLTATVTVSGTVITVAKATATVTLTVASTVPSVTISAVSAVDTPFTGKLVQNNSKARVTVSASSPTYGYITSVTVTIQGKTYALTVSGSSESASGTITSDVLAKSGSLTAKVTVKDSRRKSATATSTPDTVFAYKTPALLSGYGNDDIVCERSDSSGTATPSGTYLHIRVGRRISNIDSMNHGYIAYSVNGGSETQLVDQTSATYYTSPNPINVPLLTTQSYTVTIRTWDSVGNSDSRTVIIPTATVTFDLRRYGSGAAFGKYAEDPNVLDVSPAWNVRGRLYGLGSLPQMTAGSSANDYRVPGRYGISGALSPFPSNLPGTSGGVLTVLGGNGSVNSDPEAQANCYLIQEYRAYDGSEEWERVVVGSSGSWTFGGWRRIYPQASAAVVALTYSSNSVFSDLSGFTLQRAGPVCILSIAATPAAVSSTSYTTIATIPEGARPRVQIFQTGNAQGSALNPYTFRINMDGSVAIYKATTSAQAIRTQIPYFTDF